MAFARRLLPHFTIIPIRNSSQLHAQSHQFAEFIHIRSEKPTENTTIDNISDALRRGWNWSTLNQNFGSIEFCDSVIEKILLELQEPNDAKQALNFFHWSSKRKNIQHGISSYCITIHILVRAQLIIDARALLESVVLKNRGNHLRFLVVDSLLSSYKVTNSIPFVFDLLVQTYARSRMLEVGFDICRYLDEHGFSISIISFNSLIHFVQKSNEYTLVWKIYEHMIQKRTYPNQVTIEFMIGALCKEGKLKDFVDILDRIHGKRCSPVVIVNTCLIIRVLDEGRIEEGMMLLKRMLQKNLILDPVSYSLIIYAKVKSGNLDSAWEVYEEMLKRGFRANSFILTLFIGAYCDEGRIEEANCLMQEIENTGMKPYDQTFDVLVKGCAKADRLEESVRLFEKMVDMGLVPSCMAFNEMLGKLCDNCDVKKGDAMLTILLDKGFLPDETTYSHLINGYAVEGDFNVVLKLYYEMENRSLSPGLLVFTSVIKSLCQCGKLEEAEKYLRLMKDRSLAPIACIYEWLISSHFARGDKTRAILLQNEMVTEGLESSCS